MFNRVFHAATLHSPAAGHERKVGWIELFYDLIYVATIIQLGNALSTHASVTGFVAFAGLFVPIWFTWTGFTFYSNRFRVDDVAHRALVFLQMLGIGVVAVSIPGVFADEPQTANFALGYTFVRVILILLYYRAHLQIPEIRDMTRRFLVGFSAGAAVWLISAFLPAPWVYLAWAVAMGIDISVPLGRGAQEAQGKHPPDVLHMSERYGLLIIIVLGESFVKVLTAVAEQPQAHLMVLAGVTLLIVTSIWWIYFDDVAGSRIKRKRAATFIWVYAHLPLTIAVTAVGVAIKKAVFFDLGGIAPAKYRWLLCGTLGLALLSVALIDAVTERRQAELSDQARVNVRFASGLFVLLLAPAGAFMPSWAFTSMIAIACVAQVAFDISMAPLLDPEAAHHDPGGEPIPQPDAEPDPDAPPKPVRHDVSSAIRKGTPSELRRDLYFHFMHGSWTRLISSLMFLYFLTNVAFAALYMLEPGSVSAIREGSFIDAFSFSVQTMATIGYGAMAPTTDFAHGLMIVEAAVGILGVALATGLMFAKASRPSSAVLFSSKVVITTYHGKRMMMFRLGNARGNDVVEAIMRVSMLRDTVSPEGHRMREIVDLNLKRDRTPLFVLSWTAMHEIDADSPFYQKDESTLADSLALMVCTMSGYDATYAQQTHARHIYYPEDFTFDANFVDVISHLEDGRLQIDYNKFHDTRPDDDPIVS